MNAAKKFVDSAMHSGQKVGNFRPGLGSFMVKLSLWAIFYFKAAAKNLNHSPACANIIVTVLFTAILAHRAMV